MEKLRFTASWILAGALSVAFIKLDDPKPNRGLDLSGMDLSVSPREDFFYMPMVVG